MTIDKYMCEEGKTLNVTIVERDGSPIVEPSQTQADFTFRVTEGLEKLSDDGPPWNKKVEITRCGEKYATVRVLGDSLRDIL